MRLGLIQSQSGEKFVVILGPEDELLAVTKLPKNDLLSALQDLESFSRLNANGTAKLASSKNERMRWRPPIEPPRNIFCVGKNYETHINERTRLGDSTRPLESKPIFFTKATTSVIGSEENVIAWKSSSQIDYEAELAVIIGKKGRDIKPAQVEDYVLGYTLVNDVTARDIQADHKQWFKGKSLDTFCPLGPYLVTKDEIDWPANIHISLRLNGEVRQSFQTKDMIFDIPAIVSELSKSMTLLPGDIIATGTADGCGSGLDPPTFLKNADLMAIHSKGFGTLENKVVPG